MMRSSGTNHSAENYFCITDHVTYPDLIVYLQQSTIQKLMLVNEQTPRVELSFRRRRI